MAATPTYRRAREDLVSVTYSSSVKQGLYTCVLKKGGAMVGWETFYMYVSTQYTDVNGNWLETGSSEYLKGVPANSQIMTDGRFLKEDALTEQRMNQIRALNDLAAQRGQTLVQMALAWVLRDGAVASVLAGPPARSRSWIISRRQKIRPLQLVSRR